jgi:hypothetical protein
MKSPPNIYIKSEWAFEYFCQFSEFLIRKMKEKKPRYSIFGNLKDPASEAERYHFRTGQGTYHELGLTSWNVKELIESGEREKIIAEGDYGMMFYIKIEIEALAAAKHHYKNGSFLSWEHSISLRYRKDYLLREVIPHLENIAIGD